MTKIFRCAQEVELFLLSSEQFILNFYASNFDILFKVHSQQCYCPKIFLGNTLSFFWQSCSKNSSLALICILTCGVVDLRSSDALRRETKLDYAQLLQFTGWWRAMIFCFCSEKQNSINIIALHWPVNCYYWALTYLVSRRRASLDRRSTTPHVFNGPSL